MVANKQAKKLNPFKLSDDKEITSEFLFPRNYVQADQNFDYSSLFIIVQNILQRSIRIVDEIVQGGQQQHPETADQEITPTLANAADFVVPSCKLKDILSKIMLCKGESGPEIAHETTKSIFSVVSTYKLNAMAVLTLAAFAMEFGDFWLLARSYQSTALDQELAKSLATLKRVPAFTQSSVLQKRRRSTVQFKNVSELIGSVMKVIETMLKAEQLAATYDPLGQTKVTILNVYWIMLTVVACAAQITILTCDANPQDLTLYDEKISEILKEQNKWLNHLKLKKEEAERYDAMLKIFEHETNNAEVFDAIFFRYDNSHQLVSNAKNTKIDDIKVELKNTTRVFLFISDLTVSAEYYHSHLEKIQKKISEENKQESFKIIWAPISECQWTAKEISEFDEEFDQKFRPKFPGYTIKYISEKASIKYIKEKWQFKGKPILVVLNSEANVDTYNAFQYINAAGTDAYPFDETSLKRKLIPREWLHKLVDGQGTTTATIKGWMEAEKYVFFCGGRQKACSDVFEKAVKELKEKLDTSVELCSVEMSVGSLERSTCTLETKFFWSRVEDLFFTSNVNAMLGDKETIAEIHTLLSYKQSDAWALLIRGSKVVISGYGSIFSQVLDLMKQEKIDSSNLEAIFKEKHKFIIDKFTTTASDKSPCCRIEISSSKGKMPEEICCPVCQRKYRMKRKEIVIYECCHEDLKNKAA